jgi:AraC family transcriptional regulator, transcriptional activator FtrA
LAAMSPRTFNRKFRETVGQSPYSWLLQERIVIAKDLLEVSALSIDEVGAEAGFNSTQSFRKAFRSVTGINPTDYRRHRKEPEPARS